jgi:hypothetical protein
VAIGKILAFIFCLWFIPLLLFSQFAVEGPIPALWASPISQTSNGLRLITMRVERAEQPPRRMMADRPQKITFGEMRESGVHGVLIYCERFAEPKPQSARQPPNRSRTSSPTTPSRAELDKAGAA